MRRIGIFTGKFYSDEDYKNHDILECAMCLDPALPKEEAENQAKERQAIRKLMICPGCNECEESRRSK